MTPGQRIEAARRHANIPIFIMCNALNLNSEHEYKMLTTNHKTVTVYQQIMTFTLFEWYPESIFLLCV